MSDLAQELLQSPNVNIVDTSSNQLIQTKVENEVGVRVNPDKKFIKDSEAFWAAKGSEYSAPYQTGSFLGRGDHSNVLLSEFIKRFNKVIEQIVRTELAKTNRTAEEFSQDFKAIQAIFSVLLDHMKRANCEVKNEEFVAIMHGFINSYINSLN